MELIKIKSFELAVYLKGSPSAPKLAIVIPGRLDTKDYFHNTTLVDYLAGQGYLALSYDPPGTWESPGDIDLYTTTNCIKATEELIEHFGSKPTTLAGHSRGGTISMLVGPKNPHVSHIIPIFSYYGAPSDPEPERIRDGKLVSFRDLPPGTEKTREQKEFLLPLNYFSDGAQYDALPLLRTYTKPKLFFYGTEDEANLPEDTLRAFEESAAPKMIHAVKSDHDYRYHSAVMTEINEVIGKFLSG